MRTSNASFLPEPSATMEGHASFYWAQGRAFLVMHQGDPPPNDRAALWLISRDEATVEYQVLYFDARQVPRIYGMSFDGKTWKMWREAPGFWQRFICALSDDHRTMSGYWEKSSDNGMRWEHDFDLAYVWE